jgi:hypothetical protein
MPQILIAEGEQKLARLLQLELEKKEIDAYTG